jgi:gamma-butyrobetaine dioxygenase
MLSRTRLFKRPYWQTRAWTTYTQSTDALTIHSLDNTSFPYIWLRDSCPSSKCIHQLSKQKLHRTSDIPLSIAPIGGGGGVKVTSNGIDIDWNDGHKSSFHRKFLERHGSVSELMEEWHLDHHLKEETWTNSSISSSNLFIPYNNILNPSSSSSGLVQAITQLFKYGLVFISGVPNQETSNEICELRTLAERFGEIRTTFYGPLWDVVNGNNDGKNIAYTNLELGLHMDLLYFIFFPFFPVMLSFDVFTIDTSNIHLDIKYFIVSEIKL